MLRNYQTDCLNKIKSTDFQRGLCILPTGSGKSHILAELKGLTVAPRRELVAQNNEKGAKCVTINYAYNRKLAGNLLIIDEAHLVNKWEGMYYDVMKNFNKVIGFTATPYRLSSGHLIPDTFDTLIYDIGRDSLIEDDHLVPRKYPDIPSNLLLNVKTADSVSLSRMSKTVCPYTEAALQYFIKKWNGDKTIIYSCDLLHAKKCLNALEGLNATIISGQTPSAERSLIIQKFKNGEIDFLINCELLTTGFDCPSLGNIVILRPTTSFGLYEQICGRGDRPYQGKTHNIIYDFTMSAFNFDAKAKQPNHFKHCIFCSELTDYRLGKCTKCDKGLIRTEVATKECINCHQDVIMRAVYCTNCGQYLRKNVKMISGYTKDIQIIKQSTGNFTLVFKGLTLHNRSLKSAAVTLSYKEINRAYQLYYKYDYMGGKPMIVKLVLEEAV